MTEAEITCCVFYEMEEEVKLLVTPRTENTEGDTF